MIPANFRGRAKRLDDVDLPRIGATINVGEDHIHAVLDVESRGSGFDTLGRPTLLFEPHIFWRELGPGKERDTAVRLGLAYPTWRRDYPRDSYPRLKAAIEINETAALRSASWGLGQVMGFNHEAAGWPTVQAFVAAMCDDEENHLRAMINFIRSKRLDDEIRRRDWRGFALGYNGTGYEKNDYHNRLARAYARWHGVKDTPWNRADAAAETAAHEATQQMAPAPVAPPPKPAPVEPPRPRPDDPGPRVPPPAKPGFWSRLLGRS